jgi:hypothetical protein
MNRRSILILSLAFGSTLAPSQEPDSERAVVQAVLLEEDGSVSDTVLVSRELHRVTGRTQTFVGWSANLWPAGWHRPLGEPFLRRFGDANERSRELAEMAIHLGPRLRLMDKSRAPATASVLTLSRVGLNTAGDSALIEIQFTCPGLCGSEDLVLYVRRVGVWRRQAVVRSQVH